MEDNKVHCKYCRELISEKALICPYCNGKTPITKKRELISGLLRVGFVLLFLLLMTMCSKNA